MTATPSTRQPKDVAAPFLTTVMQIEPEWIDYNGHLNMAYYNVLFDRGIDQMWLEFGIGPDYLKARNHSTFTVECHIRYLREIHLGDPVRVSIHVIAADEKRIHTFEELRHVTEGWIRRRRRTSRCMSTWRRARPRRSRPTLPRASRRCGALTPRCRGPMESAGASTCRRRNRRRKSAPSRRQNPHSRHARA